MPIINTALTLKDLPLPPPGKSGWPWTEQTDFLPERMPDGSEWPRISIVTPSYNQGQFIEETIRSVLLQGYPNLEYIIIDGGSNDNTVEIIKKYEKHLAYWVSEPDRGQAHALNKGFHKGTGELIGWQNSDDYYHPQALVNAANASVLFPDTDIVYGSTQNVDTNGNFIRDYPVSEFDIHNMIPYLNMCNQSLFFRKKIFEENNFIDESFHHGMDLEFLVRLAVQGYKFTFRQDIRGYYRIHDKAKTSTQYDVCSADCIKIYKSIYNNNNLPQSLRQKALACIYGLCLDNFAKFNLDVFRQGVIQLATINSWKIFSPELILKYLLSFLGKDNLQKIKLIIKQYKS